MKVLVIGAGYWGSKLLERFVGLLGAENVGVYDQVYERTRPWGVQGVDKYLHLEAALLHCDACVVATPPDTHYEIAKQCLEAGKHVLVEKPMALKTVHARELVALAQAKNMTFMTDDTFLYHPWSLSNPWSMVKTLEAHWTGPRRADLGTPTEGVLFTLGPHPVSLMLKYMVRYPLGVNGHLTPRRAVLRYRFSGPDEATIILDWDTPRRARYLFWTAHNLQGGHRDFDAPIGDPEREPLLVMCQSFLAKILAPKPWIDYHGLKVVEVLDWTESTLQ